MINLCRICRQVGTSGDGPGAPCRACVRRAVARVTGRRAGDGPRPGPSHGPVAQAVGLTLTERTLVRAALARLDGRASDLALAGALPLLAVELSLRSLARRSAPARAVTPG